MTNSREVERWGVFELALSGPAGGNPFEDVTITAKFRHGTRQYEAEGFYDGGGRYIVRFMPDAEGVWTYTTSSNCREIDRIVGEFRCLPPSAGNRGPVRVHDETQFRYADGSRCRPIGTAAFMWHLQDDARREETLRSLASSPFNKLRMYLLPANSPGGDPELYPFEGSPASGFDLSRPNPTYFAHAERCVRQLLTLGIEADLVLFHPFDGGRWGFDRMTGGQEERYLRYAIARFAAFRNVWWSLADGGWLMAGKKPEDWDRLFRIVQECDCGFHLCSIQSAGEFDYGRPWVTHVSLRTEDAKAVSRFVRDYAKPVVLDDFGCEGNDAGRWHSLTPEDALNRVWEAAFRGGYATYGESYLRPDGTFWRTHGGTLRGEAVPRIEFMRGLLDEAPESVKYCTARHDASTLEIAGEYYFQYFGPHRFSYRDFALPEGTYRADLIDTWNMTVAPLGDRLSSAFRIDLPSELYYALRLERIADERNIETGE
ncbi:DUF5060 domain-containing protein [Paenibacillus cisolokensis]|uniref:DUF5060 domain-containing protein n=1 Tax=Paenibacillus cisolokensis TaxID=1658519 RepID=UPI003D2B01E4